MSKISELEDESESELEFDPSHPFVIYGPKRLKYQNHQLEHVEILVSDYVPDILVNYFESIDRSTKIPHRLDSQQSGESDSQLPEFSDSDSGLGELQYPDHQSEESDSKQPQGCDSEATHVDAIQQPVFEQSEESEPDFVDYSSHEEDPESGSVIKNFFPGKEDREQAHKSLQELEEYLIGCSFREDVYRAFKDYKETGFKKEKLSAEEKKYLDDSMRDFRRNGLALDKEKRTEVEKLKKEIAKMESVFRKNVNDYAPSFFFTKDQLDGVPASWFKNHEPEKDGTYKVTLAYPDLFPILDNCNVRATRQKIMTEHQSKCWDTNHEIFKNTIVLRYKMAKLLGYANYADYACEIKIVKNGKTAIDFENGLNKMFTELWEKDKKTLLEFGKKHKDSPLGEKDTLQLWDHRFYSRAVKEAVGELDFDTVKSYFPLDKVTEGMFKIYSTILGVTFDIIDTDNKWHKDVKVYSVKDTKTSELFGYFFLDMHPREGKYGHAAVFDIQMSCDNKYMPGNKEGRRPGVCAMVCNFPPNSTISHSDVVTFFHEFGHVMHTLLSKPDIPDHNGFAVERDFVEAPSQMLEFWCYEEKALKLMSEHPETKEPIPSSLIEKLAAAKIINAGYANKRQLFFGLFDLDVHLRTFDTEEEVKAFDPFDTWKKYLKSTLDVEDVTDKMRGYCSFAHLMGGYQAGMLFEILFVGYYGYLRSETYAANMFYLHFKKDCLNPEAGMRYRTKLLEPGSKRPCGEILEDFLGEKPNDSYFLKAKGL